MSKTILLFLLLFPALAGAQLPGSCGPGASTAISCSTACIVCNFNGYAGSTAGYPSGVVPQFCGTVENMQWVGFIAGETSATFTVTPVNCLNGDGVQVALYADCTGAPLACEIGEMGGGTLPVTITHDLAPGFNYFLMIDGYAGDWCDFTVTVDPPSAVYQPPIGAAGTVSGPAALCPGATATYTTQAIPGASAYVWNGPPGTLVNGDTVPAMVTGLQGTVVSITMGTESGAICVQGINSCQQTAPCGAALAVDVLDDSHRPVLTLDTVAHVNCIDATARLDAAVPAPGAYSYAWVADSAGTILSDTSLADIKAGTLGQYSVLVTNLVNGCTSVATVTVTGPDYPGGLRFEQQNSTCYGSDDGYVLIDALDAGTPPFEFTWATDPPKPYAEFYDLAPGNYTLHMRGSDGCTSDTVFTLTEPDELIVALGHDTLVGLGHAIQLWHAGSMVNFPARVAGILANPAVLQPMLCDSCAYWPVNSFRITVTVVDSNGCTGADDRLVLVDRTRGVYAPNAFAPESSQGNELFQLYTGADVGRVRSFRVYNRWGNLVFQRADIDAGTTDWGWNGRVNGRVAEPGVFIYAAEVEFKDGGKQEYRGEVVLVR